MLHRQSIRATSQKPSRFRYCGIACPTIRSRSISYDGNQSTIQDINAKDIQPLPSLQASQSSPIISPSSRNRQPSKLYNFERLEDRNVEDASVSSRQSRRSDNISTEHQMQRVTRDLKKDSLNEAFDSFTDETRGSAKNYDEATHCDVSQEETVEDYNGYAINPGYIASDDNSLKEFATGECTEPDSEILDTENDELSAATVKQPASSEQTSQSPVYPLNLSQDTVIAMVQMLRELRRNGLPDDVETCVNLTKDLERGSREFGRLQRTKAWKERQLIYQKQQTDHAYCEMLSARSKLPINQESVRSQILSLLERNDVLVLVSETGSGKSTQLPQMILEHEFAKDRGPMCNILCTQPRRLAATSVAKRVADEQGVKLGFDSHVGYSIRFKHIAPMLGGSIAYWTAGVLLTDLHEDPRGILSKYNTIIIDEVHERDLVTDLCLTMLRDLIRANKLANRPYPKLVLMSATVDAISFKTYFEAEYDGHRLHVASLEVAGRNFGVESHMLDEIVDNLVAETLGGRAKGLLEASTKFLAEEDGFAERWESLKEDGITVHEAKAQLSSSKIKTAPPGRAEQDVPLNILVLTVAYLLRSTDSGDILVFLPGLNEIEKTLALLLEQPLLGIDFANPDNVKMFRLHSSLYETNEEVFQPVPPGCRRVILATNIAQTSITLPDVTHVVDCGKHREMSYNAKVGYSEFKTVWTDKSTCMQRRGRAGRTRPGHYWAVFTSSRYDSLAETTTPGVKLADLAAATLTVSNHVRDMSARPFLQRMLDPPDSTSVENAIKQLQKLQMLTHDEKITSLGRFAASLPLPPAISRGLLMGLLFRCLRPLLVIASHNSDKPLIYSSFSSRAQMESAAGFSDGHDDDRFAFIRAFQQYDAAVRSREHDKIQHLHGQNIKANPYREMVNIGHQIYDSLSDYGVVPSILRSSGKVESRVFPAIPAKCDENSHDSNLVKAIALTTMRTNLAVWNGAAEAWMADTTKFFLRPYSINSKSGLKALGRQESQRRSGEIMAYTYALHTPGNTLPMLVETSSVTPLMVMLFGGPIKIEAAGIIQIDGWLRYTVKVQGDEDDATSLRDVHAVNLILEVRKALDRYLSLAFTDLTKFNHLDTKERGKRRRRYNPMFITNPIRTAMTKGIAQILKHDTLHWNAAEHAYDDSARHVKD